MQSMLNAPLTKLGLSEADAKRLSEALNVQTVRELATNEHFLLAQNCYLLAEANAKPDAAEKKHPFLELVSSITGTTVLFAALLYAAGWSYLYQYYKSFGIRVSELNLPVYDALIYSLTVIFKDGWSVFGFILLIIIAAVVLTIRRVSQMLLKPVAVGVFLVLILVIGFCLSREGARLGEAQAREDMKVESANLPNVRLDVIHDTPSNGTTSGQTTDEKTKTGTSDRQPDVAEPKEQQFAQAGFRLLIHANQHYYLFRPLKNSQSQPASNLDLYIVPDSRVRSTYIQRGL